MMGRIPLWSAVAVLLVITAAASGRVAFEKLTGLDYRGSTYYTIRNLSLWECQGWCREEPECAAASFSFVMNPLAPIQETLCLLQNETTASNPSAQPQRAVSLYYMVKLSVRTDKVCNRPWTFERVPNKMLKDLDNALIFTSTKEACLAACLNERRFTCRSAEYNYVTLQCRLSEYDSRSVEEVIEMVDVQGVDYFENLCLGTKDSCRGDRDFVKPSLGVQTDRIAHYVDMHFYVDKELMANSAAACERACQIEQEFLCRSFLYKGPPTSTSYNCQLFHLDHFTLPDGPSTFLSTDRPLLDNGERTGTFYENVCKKLTDGTNGNDGGVTGSGIGGDNSAGSGTTSGLISGVTGASGNFNGGGGNNGNNGNNGNLGITGGNNGNLGITGGNNGNLGITGGNNGNLGITGGNNGNLGILGGNTNGINPIGASFSGDGSGSTSSGGGGSVTTPSTGGGSTGSDVNCDPTGVCYDVSVHCKDTRIVVEVGTTKPFNGRIYALGRSETCNVDVINSDQFRLDLTMVGQDCNTQSANGVYTNTVVIQHHSIVMTKTDKIYKIRCTYDMTSKNITFGMLPIRDPDMIPITSAPEAPPPRIRILDEALREVETVRIGDVLTFRIEIPERTPYGIFARSCVAMAKDSRSTFQIIDDDGCPVEPAIFPHFTQVGAALQSVYEAFRFTESYGVIFQCNVKYCLGTCEPARCQIGRERVESWGRKRRGIRSLDNHSTKKGHAQETTKAEAIASSITSDDEMSISQEILVLDLGDEQSPQYKHTPLSNEDNYYTNSTYAFDSGDVMLFETCPTRSSVLALSVTCAILLLIYVLTVFYFVVKKWIRPHTKRVR